MCAKMTEMPPYLTAKDDEKNSDEDETDHDSDTSSDVDDWEAPLAYDQPRYLEPIKGPERLEHSWRVKEKYKTHCVALVLCLNVGVDPPDVVKTQPCARLECWIDPQSLSPSKALESIGHALQSQYERWQPRARYKQSLDPTSDEVKKLCCSLRRNAKDERVLFHYNGHGVPKPTTQGEIWVFNRAYTQYIPLSMYDLQTWMGAPSLYVYDCSNAGVIVDNFKQFAEQHEKEYEAQLNAKTEEGGAGAAGAAAAASAAPAVSYKNCIQLAACAAGQSLPMNPELPADLFTACLTTPVKMAMKWFVLRTRTRVAPHHVLELIDKIPGQVTDRRTMLGELNWIFTAITDTIAWSSLPAEVFQQLFRADLLTASLCRNFLLADRIMRSYNCTPVSLPALPSLARHPLWAAWEHALDLALAQLPALLASPADYRTSPFFRDQLQAFQVWLELGAAPPARPPPQQLPMVLQVLLSTLHRLRALQLLCRFLALGAWAVRAVLHVGIFPYMLKLLQASAPNLRASMVYIWARIIAVDPSCQVDLVNAKGHKYFLAVLQDPTVDSTHRTLAAYVLACIVEGYPAGQEAALQGSMISACLEAAAEGGGGPGLWACVGLARLWRGYEAARWAGVRDLAHEKLYPLLRRGEPEVRAAAAHALAAFLSAAAAAPRTDHANALDQQVAVQLAAALPHDASAIVRAEILAALQWAVLIFEQYFIAVYLQERGRRSDREGAAGRARVDPGLDALAGSRSPHTRLAPLALPAIGFGSVYMKLWNTLCMMAREPDPQISQMANDIIDYIANQVDSVVEVEVRGGGSSGGGGGSGVGGGSGGGGSGGGGSGGGGAAGSSSLPPSPLTHHEPPHEHHTAYHGRRSRTGLPHTISEDSVSTRDREKPLRDRESTSSNSSHTVKKAIVSTKFVEWAAGVFQRGAEDGAGGEEGDVESAAHHARQWRRARAAGVRRGGVALRAARLDTQAWTARGAPPPAALAFHPHEQRLALGGKDAVGVWDWGGGGRVYSARWQRAWGRAAALEWLPGAGGALLAAAAPHGQLALYRPPHAAPLAAWRALPVRRPPLYRPPSAQPLYSLAQLVSDQFSSSDDKQGSSRNKLTENDLGGSAGGEAWGGGGGAPATLVAWSGRRRNLCVGGHAAVVRVWDAATELLALELATQTEAAVTALARDGALLVAGFADGAVRAWDERTGRALHALAPPPAAAPALAVRPRRDAPTLVVVGADGGVRLVDRRTWRAVSPAAAPGPLAAAAVHRRAPLLAAASVHQSVAVYDLQGTALNTIKFHEGFMGARIGPVSCLAFHPYKMAMAVGSKDSTVSVYVSEARR